MEAIERICLCGMLVSTILLWFIQYVNNSLAKRMTLMEMTRPPPLEMTLMELAKRMTLMEDKILVLEKKKTKYKDKVKHKDKNDELTYA